MPTFMEKSEKWRPVKDQDQGHTLSSNLQKTEQGWIIGTDCTLGKEHWNFVFNQRY